METLFQDLRYALSQLRKAPGFTVTAVVTLALGIGATTAIFTLVQGILLRSLPVSHPAKLYRIGDTDDCCVNGGFVGDNGDFDIFSYDLYLHLKNSAPEFEQLAAMQAGQNGFRVRPLSESAHAPSSAPATVVSYRAWQAEFAADPSLVGSTISIETKPFM